MKGNTDVRYQGNVKIQIRKNGQAIKDIVRHNNGTITLSRAFALFIANIQGSEAYVPQYLDLQYIANPLEVDIDNLENWETYLKKIISLSGPEVKYITNAYKPKNKEGAGYEKNWVTIFRANIPYNLLTSAVEATDKGAFRFFLLSNPIDSTSNIDRRLAWVNITAEELSKLEPGTEAMIEWQVQLVHTMIDTGEDEE